MFHQMNRKVEEETRGYTDLKETGTNKDERLEVQTASPRLVIQEQFQGHTKVDLKGEIVRRKFRKKHLRRDWQHMGQKMRGKLS